MKISTWSTTAANNNQAAPNGWPEGMLRADVNNTARQDRASMRAWYEDAEWVERGDTITGSTSATVIITGDVTAFYPVGRAVRNYVAGTPTDGVITASVFATGSTTLTISGITFGATPTQFEVGLPHNSVRRIVSGTSYAKFDAVNGVLKVAGGLTLDNGSITITAGGITAAAGTGAFNAITVTSTGLVANLNASLLNSQNGAFYLNAGNLNAGTILSARLTGTYAISISGTAADSSLLNGSAGSFYRDSSNQNAGILPAARLSGTYAIAISGLAANKLSQLTGYAESGEIVINHSSLLSFTHSLGSIPKGFSGHLRCKTAELGYSVGDEIDVRGLMNASARPEGTLFSNATIVGWAVDTSGTIAVVERAAFSPNTIITFGNWRLVLRAWL